MTTKKARTPFVQALCSEIAYYGGNYGKLEPVQTIYFGGGTPSQLTEDEIQRILKTIDDNFNTSTVLEVTFEINPEDVDLDYLRGLIALGINRLSVGIQSFYENDLRFMNRSHSAEQAEIVISQIKSAGFANFSVDLIFGLPDQPFEYWAANLQKAVQIETPHLSTYSLTVEEKTVLHNLVSRGIVKAPSEESITDRMQFTMKYLRDAGYEHYEVSNYARNGYMSIHNRSYWEHKNYIGFGPSAHSFWRGDLRKPGARRWSNVRNLNQYQALLASRQLPLELRENLDQITLANEYIMIRLRTRDGLDMGILEDRYGVDLLYERIDELAQLERHGYITKIKNGIIRLTDAGILICDAITGRLLLDSELNLQ